MEVEMWRVLGILLVGVALWSARTPEAQAGRQRAIAHDSQLAATWMCDEDLGRSERVAIVFAQQAYAHSGALARPYKDALLVADALQDQGFAVRRCADLDLAGLEEAVRDFGRDARRHARTQLGVYYAGHAFQIAYEDKRFESYLIGVDFDARDDAEARDRAYRLGRLLEEVKPAGPKDRWRSFVVIDGCRSDPWTRSWDRGPLSRGLGNAVDERIPDEVFLVFATQPGRAARDDGRFAEAFASRLPDPKDLDLVMRDVKSLMVGDVKNGKVKQIPTFHHAVSGAFVIGQAASDELEEVDTDGAAVALAEAVTVETVRVPGGTYSIKGFYGVDEVHVPTMEVGRFEVDQGTWEAVMGSNPSWPVLDSHAAIGAGYPVQHITMRDAIGFCNALSARDGLEPYYAYNSLGTPYEVGSAGGWRLPTSEEWMVLATAGGTTAPPEAVYPGFIVTVREATSNAIGVFGAVDNVSEWLWGHGLRVPVGGDPESGTVWWSEKGTAAFDVASPWRGLRVVRTVR